MSIGKDCLRSCRYFRILWRRGQGRKQHGHEPTPSRRYSRPPRPESYRSLPTMTDLASHDGLSILRSLMHRPDGPGIIMLSAVTSEVDRIVALEMGADDYVIKPTSPREIMARIRSVLRRRAAPGSGESQPGAAQVTRVTADCFGFAGWTFDSRRRKLTAPGGVVVAVTETEYRMLALFLRDPHD
eukprot:gene30876-35133_t